MKVHYKDLGRIKSRIFGEAMRALPPGEREVQLNRFVVGVAIEHGFASPITEENIFRYAGRVLEGANSGVYGSVLCLYREIGKKRVVDLLVPKEREPDMLDAEMAAYDRILEQVGTG